MLKIKRISTVVFLFSVLSVTVAMAQAAKSPFTYLGIGEYYGNALAHNHGMAGVGISNPQFFYLNNQNPALLVFNRFTVFEAGFIGENRTVTGPARKESNSDGNLNYLITAFPAKLGKWTTSLGLMPYSAVNYELNYIDQVEGSTNTVSVLEKGSGGINQFFWSNGVVISKTMSVGVKASYLFSSIVNEYTNTLQGSAQPIPYFINISERNYVKDFNFTLGFSYHKDSLFRKENYKFNAGVVYDFQTNVKSEYSSYIERLNPAGARIDSTLLNENVPGSLVLPAAIAGGLSLGKGDLWMLGVDFTYLDYRNFKDFKGRSQDYGTDGWKLGVGAEITPDPTALGSYLKRMTYRTGVNYNKYPYLINGKPVYDFGINFGFSMPVSRVSSLDIALKMGKRGNLEENTIEETYFKIYFGVTFNDQWFIRRRFD
jgi:hypothetical protein